MTLPSAGNLAAAAVHLMLAGNATPVAAMKIGLVPLLLLS
jgi:hypothetical protein